jgi:heptosyltransferase-2
VTRLLVVAPNWLGDAVMALPAIADLRRRWPDASLAVAARRSVAPLFDLVGDVDLTIGPGAIAARYDVALVLPNSFRSALLVWRAGVAERWGYRTDLRGRLLTRAIARPGRVHQIEYYQHLVRALGIPTGPSVPRISVGNGPRAAAERLLDSVGWDRRRPLIGLAPGAAYGSAKRWPPAYFAALVDALAADGLQPVLLGSAADGPAAAEIGALLRPPAHPIDLVGRTDLATLAGVMAHCSTMVSNDSGAMHLAAAIGVPVVAIFGPTDERATSPRPSTGAPGVTLLTHAVWCRPCLLRECPLDHQCMRGVTPPQVLAAAREVVCR